MTIAYSGKQKIWHDWCTARGTNNLVYADKVLLWLNEHVIPRGKLNGMTDAEGNAVPIKRSTLEQYVKAVVDLYDSQKFIIDVMKDAPHPCNSLIQTVLKNYSKTELRIANDSKVDRGIGTELEKYGYNDK
ncbi:uncharacterized protein EV422DRAFT_569333 [Fimicolochytrium jonesii]|uniref:uncharacterized protein n=1 Tax=Fimicolochytrium jonesii TaxID=1396493 RepID=UPI0022FE0872|nr:uncharacterized protein EV422DRAFT_569333 [Fimicolochytrium jonesii]KAI8818661.1 hypothetical protein EV422DRAFT_569333 [Fimicolochytrium jonesii]